MRYILHTTYTLHITCGHIAPSMMELIAPLLVLHINRCLVLCSAATATGSLWLARGMPACTSHIIWLSCHMVIRVSKSRAALEMCDVRIHLNAYPIFAIICVCCIAAS